MDAWPATLLCADGVHGRGVHLKAIALAFFSFLIGLDGCTADDSRCRVTSIHTRCLLCPSFIAFMEVSFGEFMGMWACDV